MQGHILLHVITLVLCFVASADAAGRVVQLITENPSTFVAADPNDPQYIISLFDEDNRPAELPAAGPLLRSTLMTDASGQRFNCSIPGAASQFSSALAAEQQEAPVAAVPSRTPIELLDSLTGLCLYRQDGLWTYEVCHKKHVRQFRQATKLATEGMSVIQVSDGISVAKLMKAMEAGDTAKAIRELESLLGGGGSSSDAAKGKEDFSCGQYNGDDQQIEAVLEDTSSSGHHIKYVSHTYSGGADCLLTGAPRTAEVRYTCARDVKENVVLSVREFPTCNYVVVVSTPFLCKHPAFTPPVHDIRLISCLPIDEQGEAVIKELRASGGTPGAGDNDKGVVGGLLASADAPAPPLLEDAESKADADQHERASQHEQREPGLGGHPEERDEL